MWSYPESKETPYDLSCGKPHAQGLGAESLKLANAMLQCVAGRMETGS